MDLPVNADFESGYAHDPEGVAATCACAWKRAWRDFRLRIRPAIASKPLYDLPVSRGADESGARGHRCFRPDVLLVGRAECFLVGHAEPLKESIRRLQAYAEAGADVLYAPGVRERADIQAIVSAVSPKPVNVLMSANTGLKVSDLAEMGVRRISVGSSLARAAWGGFHPGGESDRGRRKLRGIRQCRSVR